MPLASLKEVQSLACSLLVNVLDSAGARLDLLQYSPLSVPLTTTLEPSYPVFNLSGFPLVQTITP